MGRKRFLSSFLPIRGIISLKRRFIEEIEVCVQFCSTTTTNKRTSPTLIKMADTTPNPREELKENPSIKETNEFFDWDLCGGIKGTWKNMAGNPVVELSSGPVDLVFAPWVGPESDGEMKWNIRVSRNKFWAIGLVPKSQINHNKNILVSPRASTLPCLWTNEKNVYMPKEVRDEVGEFRSKKMHEEYLEVWVSWEERRVEFFDEGEVLMAFNLEGKQWDEGFYFVLNGYFGCHVELCLDRMLGSNIKG